MGDTKILKKHTKALSGILTPPLKLPGDSRKFSRHLAESDTRLGCQKPIFNFLHAIQQAAEISSSVISGLFLDSRQRRQRNPSGRESWL